MCGLTGFLRLTGGLEPGDRDHLAAMTACLAHRGPDAGGEWVDADAGVALGHRRLSILELSDAGSQPMVSHSGRYVLVTNGEIYNHAALRESLARDGVRPAWRGHADTESLLAAFDHWGVERALRESSGMFALALWDRQERCLTLARDRMGEKPLYYGEQGGALLFGSELKALRRHPAFRAGVDRDQLANYLRRGYVPGPHSIHRGIRKLTPGCFVQVRAGAGAPPAPRAYWSLEACAARAAADPFRGGDSEAVDALEQLLARAVADQCVADVEIGAFLSGGVDSSAVVALMQAQAARPVRTFTIGFEDAAYDEAAQARAVAAHLGTDHTEMVVTAKEATGVMPRLPALYDEPFGDSSAIPTFLVAQLARRRVTVSLSGDGGDELFGGYTRYRRALRLWGVLRHVPLRLRAALAPATGSYLRRFVAAGSARRFYDAVVTDASAAGIIAGAAGDPPGSTIGLDESHAARDLLHAMMLADSKTYLPDDILVKVDRAAMGVGLETRVPLLDPRVVELAWRMPPRMKLRNGEDKWLLRQLLRKRLPAALVPRGKRGFTSPVGDWIRGGMRDWAESQLDAGRLRDEGFLDVARVRALWAGHLAGRTRSGEGVWRVLAFQAWLAATRAG